MKGAQLLQCRCGDFLVKEYDRMVLDKIEKFYSCECGCAKKVTILHDHMTVDEYIDGVLVNKREMTADPKTLSRRKAREYRAQYAN